MPIAYFTTSPIGPRAAAITNAASFVSGSIAPNEWLTLFIPGPLASVMFGEASGTIVSSTADQTTVIAPVRGFAPQIRVSTPFFDSIPISVRNTTSAPGIFALNGAGRGQGAILNQDTSINGPANPAARGSIVSIYATGLSTNPPMVWIGNTSADILYAGPAPQLPTGIFQVNARIPAGTPVDPRSPVFLSSGDQVSAAYVTLSVN